jgi:hypothetical protein
MKQLVIGAVLSYNLDLIPDLEIYNLDELVEMIRRNLIDEYRELDLEVEIRDYIIEEDGNTIWEAGE